jgi:hypothetical protein
MKMVRVFRIWMFWSIRSGFGCVTIQDQWANLHGIVPGPQNQSLFLQSYDPEDVITSFRSKGENFNRGHSSGFARPELSRETKTHREKAPLEQESRFGQRQQFWPTIS